MLASLVANKWCRNPGTSLYVEHWMNFFSVHKQSNITKLLNDCVYCITHSANHSLAKKRNNLGFIGLFLGKYFQVWQCLLNFEHDGMCKNMLEVFICHSLAVSAYCFLSLLHLFSLLISWREEPKMLPFVIFVTQFFLSTCSVRYFCLHTIYILYCVLGTQYSI